jgi:6-phosphogluconolactonase
VPRLTLTFRALNAARAAVFVVAGKGKAEAVRAVLQTPPDPTLRPAQGISLSGGHLGWILDRSAASLLEAAR